MPQSNLSGYLREPITDKEGRISRDFLKYLQGLDTATKSLAQYKVGTLPTKGLPEGSTSFAVDGRKQGEGPGAGTGVPCYFSATKWRRYSDDTQVEA